MWRLLALTFAVAHGDLLTEDSDHDIHVFQKHSWPTSLRSNMLDTAITKTLHVHGNLDVEGKLVHGAIILNITNLASKTELAEAVAASTAGLNITNLASNVFYSTDEVDAKIAAVQSATSGFLSVQNNSITIGSTVLSEQTLKDLNDLVDITDITIENNITIGSTVLSEQTLKDLNGLLALNLTKLAALLDITDIID